MNQKKNDIYGGSSDRVMGGNDDDNLVFHYFFLLSQLFKQQLNYLIRKWFLLSYKLFVLKSQLILLVNLPMKYINIYKRRATQALEVRI